MFFEFWSREVEDVEDVEDVIYILYIPFILYILLFNNLTISDSEAAISKAPIQ